MVISDATPNAIIHYTVDGSPPTKESPIYNQPLVSLPTGVVVRAIATADGHTQSSDITGVYIWSRPTGNPTADRVYAQGKDSYDHKKYSEARKIFAQSCNAGDMRACNYLGFIYAQGLGGARDLQKAREVYQTACDHATLSSCASLGSIYQDAGNNDEARNYFKKACNGGSSAGCELLRGVQ